VRQMTLRVPSSANSVATAAPTAEGDGGTDDVEEELAELPDVQRVGSDVSAVSRTRSGEREGLVSFDPANPGAFIEGYVCVPDKGGLTLGRYYRSSRLHHLS